MYPCVRQVEACPVVAVAELFLQNGECVSSKKVFTDEFPRSFATYQSYSVRNFGKVLMRDSKLN